MRMSAQAGDDDAAEAPEAVASFRARTQVTTLYFVQSSIFYCFNRPKERSLVTKMASAANA
jgi:hypothetical protein